MKSARANASSGKMMRDRRKMNSDASKVGASRALQSVRFIFILIAKLLNWGIGSIWQMAANPGQQARKEIIVHKDFYDSKPWN